MNRVCFELGRLYSEEKTDDTATVQHNVDIRIVYVQTKQNIPRQSV